MKKIKWLILDWKICGIGSENKHDTAREKIDESNCAILCLQETKRESFDHSYIRKFAPKRFDQFAFFPSVGSSGGIITIWNGALFHGQVIESTSFVVHIKFTSHVFGQCWHLLNIYGPCAGDTREIFV
jgi:hypothetical protein